MAGSYSYNTVIQGQFNSKNNSSIKYRSFQLLIIEKSLTAASLYIVSDDLTESPGLTDSTHIRSNVDILHSSSS